MKTNATQPFVLGFYGYSNSGKTTIITNLIKNFYEKNYRVVSVKITDKNICIDKEGKDSFKHAQAGSKLVVFSSSVETSYIFKENQNVEQIIENIIKTTDVDIIFIEGAHDSIFPKIRIGNIKKRSNTIGSYNGDSDNIFIYVFDLVKKHFGVEK